MNVFYGEKELRFRPNGEFEYLDCEDAIKLAEDILKKYSPDKLITKRYYWKIKEEFIMLVKIMKQNGSNSFLYLNTVVESNTVFVGDKKARNNYKTMFSVEEFYSIACKLNIENFFEAVNPETGEIMEVSL